MRIFWLEGGATIFSMVFTARSMSAFEGLTFALLSPDLWYAFTAPCAMRFFEASDNNPVS